MPNQPDFFRFCVRACALFGDVCATFAYHLYSGWARRVAILTLATIVLCAVTPELQAATFPDVSARHPHSKAIESLVSAGVFRGYPDGTFRPGKTVNRAEALKIIFLGSGIPVDQSTVTEFPDAPPDSWFAPFVATARLRTIASGYPDGTFRPEKTVNIVEVLKILLVANGIELTNYTTARTSYADVDPTAWYGPFVTYAETFNLLSPDAANKIHPDAPLSRAAIAEILYRFRERVARVCPTFFDGADTITTKYFANINLATPAPTVFFEGEIANFTGTLTGTTANKVTVFYVDTAGHQTSTTGTVKNGLFSVSVPFRTPGSYQFSMLPGVSGQSFAAAIEIAPRECLPAEVARDTAAPADVRLTIENGQATIRYRLDDGANLVRVVIRQGGRRYERLLTGGQTVFAPAPADFTDFTEGAATLQLFAAKSEHGWSNEPHTRYAVGSPLDFKITQFYFSEYRAEALTLDGDLPSVRSGDTVTLTGMAHVTLSPTAYVIRPDGRVAEVRLGERSIAPDTRLTATFPTTLTGTTILEINDANGLAAINHPVYEVGSFPLLPDFTSFRERTILTRTISINRERAIWLRLVNDERARYNLPRVELDAALTSLAQGYADRMAHENFFGHVDPAGRTPDDRRIVGGIPFPVGENLAKDVSTTSAHAGLMRSASHRSNILDPAWSIVGLGVATGAHGEMILVQEFGTKPLAAAELDAMRQQIVSRLNTSRSAKQLTPFVLSDDLAATTQNWSTKMVTENFFGFEKNGNSLEKNIRASGITGSFSTFVASTHTVLELADSVDGSTSTLTNKLRVSIGIAQGTDGAYRGTFVFW